MMVEHLALTHAKRVVFMLRALGGTTLGKHPFATMENVPVSNLASSSSSKTRP